MMAYQITSADAKNRAAEFCVNLKKCTGEIIGIPLAIVVTGVNRDDVSQLASPLAAYP